MNLVVFDANIWVAAYDPEDPFHAESVEVFQAAVRRGLRLAGPACVVLESVCALARRAGDAQAARAARDKMAAYPALHLEPISEALLTTAEQLGVERRLRGADALYAATAARLGCRLLSWDSEPVSRGGALSPRDWLAADRERAEDDSVE